MTPTQVKLKAMAKSHPVLAPDKMAKRLTRLEKIRAYYVERIDQAPEGLAVVFTGFVASLAYAINIIKLYRSLTIKLAELAEGDEDESNTKQTN